MKQSAVVLSALLASALLSTDTNLYAYAPAADTANKQASSFIPAPAGSATPVIKPVWQAKTTGTGLYDARPPVSNGLVYYAAGDKLIAANLATGKVKWTITGGRRPDVVTKNSVFYVTDSGYLVRADAKSGKVIWKTKGVNPPSELGAHARLVNGDLIYFNESGGIGAYHPASGKKKWENKALPMYASSLIGQYNGILVVSGTVDNTRTQFFGLDSATGKQRWRTEGSYSFFAYRNGRLMLRRQPELSTVTEKSGGPGYLVTWDQLDPRTGTVTGTESYTPLEDVSRLGNSHTAVLGSYLYTVDGNLDKDEAFLHRYTLGQGSTDEPVNYESYGKWQAGPEYGIAFFSREDKLTGVRVSDNTTIDYGQFPSPVSRVQAIGKGVFASLGNGEFYMMETATGTRLGRIATNASEIGNAYTANDTLLIQTNEGLFAAALPKSLKFEK